MAHADWIIDVGPGAGHDGGWIVFEGTPTYFFYLLLAPRSPASTSRPTSPDRAQDVDGRAAVPLGPQSDRTRGRSRRRPSGSPR